MLNTAPLFGSEIAGSLFETSTTGTMPKRLLIPFQELIKDLADIDNNVDLTRTLPAYLSASLLLHRLFSEELMDLVARTDVSLSNMLDEDGMMGLEDVYIMRNPEDIKAFLRKYGQVVSVVTEATPIIAEFFGPEVSLALEVIHDPESTDVQQLFGYIHSKSLSPEEALERLNAFDDHWFLNKLDSIGGLLNFTLE